MTVAMRALDTQLDLLRWSRTEQGVLYAEAVGEANFARINGAVSEAEIVGARNLGYALNMLTLVTGEVYGVTEEIVDVLEQAAALNHDETFHQDEVPARAGFVWMERPIVTADSFGKPIVVHAFGWCSARYADGTRPSSDLASFLEPAGDTDPDGLVILLWTCPGDPRDHFFADEERLALYGAGFTAPGGLTSMIGGIWPFDDTDMGVVGPIFSFVLTFWQFIESSWVDASPVDPGRPARKRAARMNVEPSVKVVRLRRKAISNPNPQPSPIDWQHRWVVAPHKRRQWYPSLQRHKTIWIASYVKGPADKPLVVHDRVFEVER